MKQTKIFGVILCMALVACMSVTAFAADTAVTVADVQTIVSTITDQISVANIMAVLVAGVGASIGFVFMWFGVRKLIKIVMSAFRKGKVSA